jgi:alpha-amylase/alpha-mannosidase (GH57 family)
MAASSILVAPAIFPEPLMHLILCIHNHQPVGNMDSILEEAYERSYRPFFDLLKEFPGIKINLHFSGFLFNWLDRNRPKYVELLRELKGRGQIEVISGGMYEPILPLLPEEDGILQIKTHADYMEKVFGARPRGMWLAERVYEPQMPRILNKAGMEFTLVDDNHFKAVGMRDEDLLGYFITEYEGRKLKIFPGLEVLRYAIPFKTIKEIDAYFRKTDESGGKLAVFGDDGEKFGLWPGTYGYVYEEGWLRSFFEYLEAQEEWLKTVTFSEYLDSVPPSGLVYLECQSYKEMGEWSLPARLTNEYSVRMHDGKENFLKGGYFKNFLVKYPESNDMHKKMLSVTGRATGNDAAKQHALMGQCNDSYWHGVFGGLYLPHLRGAIYTHLIEAEKLLDPQEPFVEGFFEDANVDGVNEAILNNDVMKAYFFLREGGAMYELDFKPSSANMMATLCRRYEGYHDKIREAASAGTADGTKTIHDMVLAKEEGLDKILHYDWYRRGSLIDHVLGQDVDFDEFHKGRYVEPGDFVKEPYEAVKGKGDDWVTLSMGRVGHFWKRGEGLPLSISKDVTFYRGKETMSIEYSLEGKLSDPFLFGVEFNFSFLGSGGDRYLETEQGQFPLSTADTIEASEFVRFFDPYQDAEVLLSFDKPQKIWTFPVEVVSLSEQGFERNYQCTMVMPLWEVNISSSPRRITMSLQLRKARK